MPAGGTQAELFGLGGSAALSLYRPLGRTVVPGLRVRGGMLSDAGSPDDPGRVDPGTGGFASLSLAVRIRPFAAASPERGVGPFVEAGAGPTLTGDLVRVGVEAGLGWGIPIGAVDLAPTLRYMHVFQPDDQLDGGDARLVMLGLEVTLFDARPAAPRPVAPLPLPPAVAREPEPEPAPLPPIPSPRGDRDGDGIFDDEDACPDAREIVNGIDDLDGCPDEGLIELVNDRIVIEERVFFAYDRAFVRPNARPILEAIVTLWRQHPEWRRIRIEGHTDMRGAADYNLRLSERRARAVMEALIERGMTRELMESAGFGETRPLNRGTREATHRRNRRVEFVVLSRRAVPAGTGERAATRQLEVLSGRDR